MPGREDLIQKNAVKVAKASAAVNTPQPQESEGKSATSSMGGPRSLFGGNIDVYSALEAIEFQKGSGDGSLRGDVAYIRLWKRGSTQQSSASPQTVQPPQFDSQAFLEEQLNDVETDPAQGLEDYIFGLETITTPTIPEDFEQNPEDFLFELSPIDGEYDTLDDIVSSTDKEERKEALSGHIPTSSEGPSKTVVSVPPNAKTSPQLPASKGAVRSANPNGLLNIANKVGRTLIGLPQGKPEYSGKLNDKSASAMAPEAMWQFLFNPSELELEVGPEFKNAEVWGVSDKANSGQPLHWSHNKNAQLKFNSILLNGYVFGRKVEALEQGLIALFMARDGEGQHGPHVLEFVWGKRVFGPCVMKNINIKEKMWDEGEVVNAEVSFTLEQVPEWTINDGFVDVARPGRQKLIENPVPAPAGTTAAGTATPAGTTAPVTPTNPGASSSSSQKPSAIASKPSAQFCTQATNAYSNFESLAKKSSQSWTDNVFGASDSRAIGLGKQYNSLLLANKSISRALVGLDQKCSKGCQESSYYYKNTATLNTNAYVGCVRTCSYQVASKIQGSYFDDKSCLKPQFVRPA